MADFVNFVILRTIPRVAAVLAALTLAATGLALFASRWWLADLAVHFRPQYAVLAALAAVVLGAARRWAWAVAALVALGVNALAIVAVLEPGAAPIRAASAAPPAAAAPATHVRVLAMNVFYGNTHYERVRALVRAAHPDVAVLVEITPQWLSGLKDLRKDFPYGYYAARWRMSLRGRQRRGVLLLSRWPIAQLTTLSAIGEGDPSVDAALLIRGRRLRLIGVHASWPLGRLRSLQRNAELEHLGSLADVATDPLVIAGDLNVTPFSPYFQHLLERGGLRSADRGWAPTWPTFLPPAGIRIDHVLVSSGVSVLGWQRGSRMGSDHWPVIADLAF